MSRHDQKDQIKNLLDLEAQSGPVVTITIPLNPKLDDTRLDKIQTDSLVDSAKDAFQKVYKPELWNAYEFQIKNYLKTLKPNASIAKGVVLYVTNDSLVAYKLNYTPQPSFSFSDKLQVLPVVKQLQFVPNFDMLFLQRDSYKFYNVKDLDVTDPDNVPADPFNSDKTETNTIHDSKKNGPEFDTHDYFEEVDKYVQKRYSDTDHNPLVLVANATKAIVEQNGGKAVIEQGDISDEESANKLVQTAVDAFGVLDVFFNNAGMEKRCPTNETSLDDWNQVISVDLTGTFLGTKAALNYWLTNKKQGAIVNTSSVHQQIP